MTTGELRDPEMALSLVHVPAGRREAIRLLWLLDERLGAIVAGAHPPIAAIKLAWWREALERLDSASPPAEPLLCAIAEHLLPAGIFGTELAAVADGWDSLLEGASEEESDQNAVLLRHARNRGGGLFTLAARLLGEEAGAQVTSAGETWALTSLGPPWRDAALPLAHSMGQPRGRWPRRLRALGMLAVLAWDSAERGLVAPGSPRRIVRALWHRLSGY